MAVSKRVNNLNISEGNSHTKESLTDRLQEYESHFYMVQKLFLYCVGGEEKGVENQCKDRTKTETIIGKEHFLIKIEFTGKLPLKINV
jgi:hypothetical protein